MATKVRGSLLGYLKQSWHESPETTGSFAFLAASFVISYATIVIYDKNDGNNRKHRASYIVYRHDDPRVPSLKTSCDLTSRP